MTQAITPAMAAPRSGRLADGFRALQYLLAGLGVIVRPWMAFGGRWVTSERRRADVYLGEPVAPRPAGIASGRWRMPAYAAVRGAGGLFGLFVLTLALFIAYAIASWWIDPFWVQPAVYIAGVHLQTLPMLTVGCVLMSLVWLGLLLKVSPAVAGAQARLYRRLPLPAAEQRAEELAERVGVLTRTRVDALDAHGAELRRIERDLHDGAQARLVTLTMRLGVAEKALVENPEQAATLVREARAGAEEAMTELRDVVRTIYPPILADRGLSGAVSALAARCAVPAKVTVEELGPVPAPVETAAYFVVAEALTNAAKHSAASQVLVGLSRPRGGLRVEVLDDGVGGVDESTGTGIAGIRRRVAALDGTTTIDSPAGGPTTIDVELPCES